MSVHQAPHVICRAYGGSLSANTEADQDLGFQVTYPDGVHQGDTFNIKIRPDVSLYPCTDSSTGIEATIQYIYNQVSSYLVPAGLSINSVSQGPINGNVEANPDVGYYVDAANVPHSVVSGVGDVPTEGFDPMTLPASQRLADSGYGSERVLEHVDEPRVHHAARRDFRYDPVQGWFGVAGADGHVERDRDHGAGACGPAAEVGWSASGCRAPELRRFAAQQLRGAVEWRGDHRGRGGSAVVLD